MKKLIGLASITIIVIFLVLCGINKWFFFADKVYFEDANLNEVQSLLEGEGDGIIYYGSVECSACRDFSPILKKTVDEASIKVYYINAENEEFSDIIAERNFEVKPTILVVESGKISRFESSDVYDGMAEIFNKKMGY